jgi:hypothetical protein
MGNRTASHSLIPRTTSHAERTVMLAKILGAIAGEKFAGRNQKVTGALVGAAIPVIARRGLGPLGLALAAGWGAKKLIDYRRTQRGRSA